MADVGVVAALPKEAAMWHGGRIRAGHIERADHIKMVVAGIGAQRAADAATRLLDAGADALVSWGVAGGLASDLLPGALVIPDRVLWADGEHAPDAAWRGQLLHALKKADVAVSTGWLWCHPHAVTSVQDKRALSTRGCVAVDMESAAVARVASGAGVPFVAIKSICDPADRAVPSEAVHLLDADGHVRPLAVALALARGPLMWRAMRCMRADFDTACAGLDRAAAALPLSCPA